MNVIQTDDQYIAHTYARYPIVITHGSGSVLFDEQDNRYIDMTAGIGVNALGHGFVPWVEAITKQAMNVGHTSNLYYTKPDSDVAKMLCQRSGFLKMMFANSGAEANEGAIKVARKYSFDAYGAGRNEIITLVNSFHGRTITTLSATGQDHFHTFFDPFTPGFTHAIANDFEDMLAHVTDKTCAIMLEMIQGEGGVLPLAYDYVQQVATLCKERDILLIVDEVQTGIGRCGTLFAYEQYAIQPDIVSVAKGLGGGLPIGGVLLHEKVKDTFQPGDHGSTFGGNPIACAGAAIIVSHIDDTFLEEVRKKGETLKARLLNMEHVEAVNGKGLMLGVVLKDIAVKDVVQACMKRGVLALTAKDKLRLLPPLNIREEDLQQAMDILEDVLHKI